MYKSLTLQTKIFQSRTSIIEAWIANKDFTNVTVGVSGTYANRSDVERYYPEVERVVIRFREDRHVVVLTKGDQNVWPTEE